MHCITFPKKNISCQIVLPKSKSIINRMLVINYLSCGKAIPDLISEASDVLVMQDLLTQISYNNNETVTEINVGNAGTVMRFLLAVLAITPGKWLLTGSERMKKRPVKPLTDALQQLGASITFNKNDGFPPVYIIGNGNLEGGNIKLNAGISSQFISALMMIGPYLKGGLSVELQGDIISWPYIEMTRALMEKSSGTCKFNDKNLKIIEGSYIDIDLPSMLEPDWSAAAFWFEIVALAPEAEVLLLGLTQKSVQGDAVLPLIYEHLGVKSVFTDEGLVITKSAVPRVTEFDFDFTNCPDLAQAVIVTCAALGITGRFTGLKTLRIKETDRIAALHHELTKLDYHVEVVGDQIILNASIRKSFEKHEIPVINCYDDHRMAMSFAPLALLHTKICIGEPETVRKSYPEFWEHLVKAGFLWE
ncbi:MAG: 3-phosphoshikimate 1-carboxyvinyltransferase [Bacteroidales bacterium]